MLLPSALGLSRILVYVICRSSLHELKKMTTFASTIFAAFLFVLMLSQPSFSQPSEKEVLTEIADNISYEYIECGVYFQIAGEGLKKAGNLEFAKKYDDLVDLCYLSAYQLIVKNREKSMADKVATSRVSMVNSSMRKEINNNYSNLSIISDKYLNRCIEIINDPSKMIKSWKSRIKSKYK